MIGFRIATVDRFVAPETIEKLRRMSVANIADCMSGMTGLGSGIRPLHQGAIMVGPAITVKSRPGDALMIHKALDMARPGDVLVVDGAGDLTNALMGEPMFSYAARRGLAGVVVNGAIRNLDWIKEHNFPVFAAGVALRGPYNDGPGEINFPISINGTVVDPGDVVMGDNDGILAVRPGEIEQVCTAAAKKRSAEARQLKDIEEGICDRTWIDEALRQRGLSVPGSDTSRIFSF